MSILVYIENIEGAFKKSAFEAISYAKAIGELTQQEVQALSIGQVDESELNKVGKYGVGKVIRVNTDKLSQFQNQAYAAVIADVAKQVGATSIILSNSFSGKGLAPRVAAK